MRDDEGKAIVVIPPIVGIVVIGIEPTTVIIAVHIQQIRIAISNVREAIWTTTPRLLLRLYSIWHM